MEKPSRERTLKELGDSVVFWATEMRKAEKEVIGAVAGTLSAAKRKQHYAKKQMNEVVDVLLARIP